MNNFLLFLLKIFFLLLLILALFVLMLFLIDSLGIFNTRIYFPEFMRARLFKEAILGFDHSGINLDGVRIVKEREAIDLKSQQLEKLKEELKQKEDNLNKLESEFVQKQKELDQKQKIIDDVVKKYNDEDANIYQTAVYLMNMPPDDAVKRLEEFSPELSISYMRKVEELSKKEGRSSIVPYWLSLMDVKKAAILMRKMSVVSLLE